MITSSTNSKLKLVRALLDSKKARDAEGFFVLESPKVIAELQQSNSPLLKFCLTPELLEPKLFNSLFDTQTNQGILAVVQKPTPIPLAACLGDSTLDGPVLILDELQDPGNVGTIIRTAVAFNCKAIIYTKGTADLFSPKVVRASAGAILQIPIYPLVSLEGLKEAGYNIVTTSVADAASYQCLKNQTKLAIVFSNEGSGVSRNLAKLADIVITIPHSKSVDSLNVAVSAGIILNFLSNK